MIIALTGHREQRLNLPSDVSDKKWDAIRTWIWNTIVSEIDKNPNDKIICFTGLASGSDMALGYTVANMKKAGFNVELHAIAPCRGYGRKNPNYQFVMENTDKVINIHDKWVKTCDNDRDEYMAAKCDKMIAIYDRIRTGGVFNTIKKCNNYNKEVIYCPEGIVTKYQDIF